MNDDQIIEQIRDEVAGIAIGSGYYSTAIGIDEAREVATAVLPIVKAACAEALRGAAGAIEKSDAGLPGMTVSDAVRSLRFRADDLDEEPTR